MTYYKGFFLAIMRLKVEEDCKSLVSNTRLHFFNRTLAVVTEKKGRRKKAQPNWKKKAALKASNLRQRAIMFQAQGA